MGYKPGGGGGAVGPAGPAAGSFQALTPLAINGNNAVHATSGALVATFLPYTDPNFYVDPVGGNDANSGAIGAPFLTVDRALQIINPGYLGFATINLRAGTSTIGARTVIPSPIGNTNATAGGVLFNGVDNTDSGLGARTSAGGTAGSLATFGTCIDSVGGLGVNAYRGQFIRFTSGASLNGRSFLIVSNTATTFTVAGTLPVAPTVETFVVETPAAVLTWAGNQIMQAEGAVGFNNVAFSGPGGANALRLSRGIFGVQRCTFAALGSAGIQLRNGAVFQDLNAMVALFGTFTILQQCGAFFNTTPISIAPSSATGMYPGGLNFNRSFLLNSPTESFGPQIVQFLGSQFEGNSYIRGVYSANILLGQDRFETVTPSAALPTAFAGAFGAALVASKRSNIAMFNVVVNNTPATFGPGDAILVEDGSTGQCTNTTGTGNAGIGCRVNRMSQVRNVSANTVAGAGGQVKIGTAPVSTWAALGNQQNVPELCLGTTP